MEESSTNFYRFVQYYFSKWLIILVFLVVGLTTGYIFNNKIQKPQYRSEATILLINDPKLTTVKESTIIFDYIELLKSRRVLEPAITESHLNTSYTKLLKQVQASNDKDAAVIKLSIVTGNPLESKELAQAILKSFKIQVANLYGTDSTNIVDNASLPNEPYNVRKPLQLIISGVLSIFLSTLTLYIIYDYRNNTASSSKKLQRKKKKTTKNFRIPRFAVIPRLHSFLAKKVSNQNTTPIQSKSKKSNTKNNKSHKL